MLWLLIFVLPIIVVFSYLLFAPFYIEVNSLTGFYGLRFHHLAAAWFSIKNETFVMDISITGFEKQIDLLSRSVRKEKKRTPAKPRHSLVKISFTLIKDIVCSFKVNQCYLTIDTGDKPLNGLIYPLFYWVARYFNKSIGINFLERNVFVLEVENNVANILKTIIYSKIKTGNHGKFK